MSALDVDILPHLLCLIKNKNVCVAVTTQTIKPKGARKWQGGKTKVIIYWWALKTKAAFSEIPL